MTSNPHDHPQPSDHDERSGRDHTQRDHSPQQHSPREYSQRDVDEEFRRLLEREGLSFSADPEQDVAPPDHVAPADSAPDGAEPGLEQGSNPPVWRASSRDPDLDDEDVIYGDFEPPDPQLEPVSPRIMWGWVLLLGGFTFAIMGVTALAVPWWVSAGAAITSLSGMVILLMRLPREKKPDGDGAEV